MGYKIPDLKEDIKKDVEKYYQTNWPLLNERHKLQEDILDIVDKHFEKIESQFMKTKTYEVEFKSTTSRQYRVDAKNKAEAEEKAIEELQMDTEVSSAWVENSKVSKVLPYCTWS